MNAADLARRRRVQLVAAYQRWRRTLDDGMPTPRWGAAPTSVVPLARTDARTRRTPG
jgi:hypothetical protein